MTIQPAAAAPVASKAPDTKDSKLRKACQEFEGQFFALMLQEMRKTVPQDAELGDDADQQQIFQGMMDDNIAQQMAVHGGANDLSAQMYKQLSHQNLTKSGTSATPSSQPMLVSSASALKSYVTSTENEKR